MKGGKGTIPYAVLKETREELAEVKRRLESLQAKPYQAVIPENHAEMVSKVQADLQALNEKFETGDELEWDEYQKQLAELTAQRENLLAARIKAEISSEMQAAMQEKANTDAKATWDETVQTFLASNPDGINYSADPAKLAELDAAVKMFANNPANAKRDSQWFLDKAHREFMENNDIEPAAKQPPPAKEEAKEDDAEKAPFNSLSDIAGGLVPESGSEASKLVALDIVSLRNRMMNDPSQVDAMLAGFQ
jgi:hypothetical protein